MPHIPSPTACASNVTRRTWAVRALAVTVLVSAAVMAMKPASADEDSEREQLARISYELQRLQSMVDEAGRRAPTGQRISFRYEWLKRDLALVQRGVDDHLDAPRQPRVIPPLRGEYRQ